MLLSDEEWCPSPAKDDDSTLSKDWFCFRLQLEDGLGMREEHDFLRPSRREELLLSFLSAFLAFPVVTPGVAAFKPLSAVLVFFALVVVAVVAFFLAVFVALGSFSVVAAEAAFLPWVFLVVEEAF